MDHKNLAQNPARPSWHQLADEGAALELLEYEDALALARGRVAELEAHQIILTEIATLGIHRSHQAHLDIQTLKAQLSEARATIRELRDATDTADDLSTPTTPYRPLPPIIEPSEWLHQ